MSELHRPPFNLVITNVPGPQLDMYVAGHRLLSNMGMAPIVDGMGLLIVVFSYNGVLSISPTSSPAVMPDLDAFARYLRESANELEAEVLKLVATRPAEENGHPRPSISPEQTAVFFDQVRSALESADDSPSEGRVQFRVTGGSEQNWVVDIPGKSVTMGEASEPDATLTIRDEHLAQILSGKLDPQIAFVQGKLRVDGDIGKAIEFGSILPSVAS